MIPYSAMFERNDVIAIGRQQQQEALSDRRAFANVNESGPDLTNNDVIGVGKGLVNTKSRS